MNSFFKYFNRLFESFITPEIIIAEVNEIGVIGAELNTSYSSLTVPICLVAISTIFLVGYNAQIFPAVVSGITVYMIYNFLWVGDFSLKDSLHNKSAQVKPLTRFSSRFSSLGSRFLSAIVAHMKVEVVLLQKIFINVINLKHGISIPISQSLVKGQGGALSLTLFQK